MTNSAIILDPQRSALVSMGIEEGFLAPPREVDLNATPAFMVGRSPARRAAVLEMLLLHDALRLIHHEQPGDTEALREEGHFVISLLPLRATGLVEFDGRSPAETGLLIPDDPTPSEFWKLNERSAKPWAPLLAEYVFAKGHVESLALAREYCEQIGSQSDTFNSGYSPMLHVSMISTFGELLQAESIAATGATCTQPITSQRLNLNDRSAAHRVMQIVIDEVLDNEFTLPVPATLGEALKLQGDPNVREFRAVFHPWITTLREGTLNDESRLRLEVRRALRVFRNLPRIQRLTQVLAYFSVPVGLVQRTEALVAGTAIGVASIGLSALAERWHTNTKWLGLARRDT
jgi:hypothetical protein